MMPRTGKKKKKTENDKVSAIISQLLGLLFSLVFKYIKSTQNLVINAKVCS